MPKTKRKFTVKSNINQPKAVPAESEITNKSERKRFSLQGKLLSVATILLVTLGALGSGLKFLEENARLTIAQRNSSTALNPAEETLLSKINPFVPAAVASPTPQLSKEYLYAGSRLLAVEDKNAAAAPPADLAIFRPSSGGWWVLNSSGQGYTAQNWGVTSDLPVEGDYDGDGKTDFAVFHPADGSWQVLQSSNSAFYGFQFGLASDTTAQADYDGDGKTDLAIFRNENGNGVWYVRRSSDGTVFIQQWGLGTDIPTPKDYDGDGKADVGVWRASNTTFYSVNSSDTNFQSFYLGQSGTKSVSADYDGDGRADYAIFDSSNGNWVIRNSSTNQTQTYQWGQANDIAVPNDYDGDGKVDLAVWRNSNGNWYIRKSGSGGSLRQEQWGMSGDIPVPAYYRR